MKKLLGLSALLLALNTTALAQVNTVEENFKIDLKYPAVVLDDTQATHRINAYYSHAIDSFTKEIVRSGYNEASTSYEVKYEDDKYLSLATTYWHYLKGAAHGMYYTDSAVFAKNTGAALPLSHFLPQLPQVEALDQAIREGKVPFYSINSPEPLGVDNFFGLDHISDSYYIDADRNVYLVYAPYDLACYAVGTTVVKLNPEIIESL